jgi:hypothetical protein
MQEPVKVVKSDALDLEGLEQVFEAECEPIEDDPGKAVSGFSQGSNHSSHYGSNYPIGLSIKAACIHYQMSASTLRKKIRSGEIPAEKIEGVNGPEWRVLVSSSSFTKAHDQGSNHVTNQGEPTLVTPYQPTAEINQNQLLELVDKQASKLEAASGQIGYLSARVESYENQVRLLPDLEAKAARVKDQEETITQLSSELTALKATWWYRLYAFVSNKK